MKHIFSMIKLQAVALLSFFAISSTVLAEMPAQPQPIWTNPLDNVDGATIAKDSRR
ncbi:hypothetical protein Q7376_08720 [Glaesserella parasuis]|nr:hypothetical protein [Glaesserella parasuis]MDP0050386.1 hypothetical protein [Glaesserella parasuis]